MKCYLYKFPVALLDSENVPDYHLFDFLTDNYISVDTRTVINYNSTVIQFHIQMTSATVNSYFNLLQTYDGLYFNIINWTIVQQSYENPIFYIVQAEVKINVYLSFCVQNFNINSLPSSTVFFKRKHVNRYLNYSAAIPSTWQQYGTSKYSNSYIDFRHQQWLLHLDDDLKSLKNEMQVWNYYKNTVWGDNAVGNYTSLNFPGTQLDLQVATLPTMVSSTQTPLNVDTLFNQVISGDNYIYNNTFNQSSQLNVFNHQLQYLYAVLNMSAGSFTQSTVNYFCDLSNFTNQTEALNINLLLPIWNTHASNMVLLFNQNAAAQINISDWSGLQQFGIDIFSAMSQLSKNVMVDIVVLPFLWTEFITNKNQNPIVSCSSFVNQADFTTIPNANNSSANSMYNGALSWEYIYGLYLSSIFYVSHVQSGTMNGDSTQSNDVGNTVEEMYIYNTPLEPMTLNPDIYHWKIKFYNHEDIIDLSNFENVNFSQYIDYSTFLPYLFNYKILYNYPNTNITNLTMFELENLCINLDNILDPLNLFNKNVVSFEFLSCQQPYKSQNLITPLWNKGINNQLLFNVEWRNIIASVSNNWSNFQENNHNQYLLGRNLGLLSIASSVFGIGMSASEGLGGIGGAVGGLFGLGEKLMDYNYKYDGGMRADYSRAPELRASGSLNAFNNGMSILIQENYLNDVALNIVSQRYMLNGYVVNRFLPFNYWYNRKYWDWVSIENYTTVFLSSLPKFLADEIDTMMKRGIRVIHTEAFDRDLLKINWELWNQNTEINPDSNVEIALLNGATM